MRSVYSKSDEKPEFWFNLRTLEVEVGRQAPAPDRVGPFLSEAEAKAALETLRARSTKWAEEED